MIQIPYYETSNFVFSNFSAHAVEYKGVTYATVEHAFHAQKFDQLPEVQGRVVSARSPLQAWELAREFRLQRRADWDDVKVDILTEIVRAKVAQHKEVYDALLATGDEEIVELNPNDDFWGSGPDGNGRNQMGKILMAIRDGPDGEV